MTEKETYIVNLVMDESVLRKIAWLKWSARRTIRDEIFLKLVGHWVVHSELGLDHEATTDLSMLKQVLREGGISCAECNSELGILLPNTNLTFTVEVGINGATTFISPHKSETALLSASSILKLIQFADSVIPEVERMVNDEARKLEQEELASSIASKMLHTKLGDMGVLYHILENRDILEIDIFLPPDGKLHFSIKADKVDETLKTLDETVAAAVSLYGMYGINLSFRPLERWDRWAEPYNRNV